MRVTDAATIPRDRTTSGTPASVTLHQLTVKDSSVDTMPVFAVNKPAASELDKQMPRRRIAASLFLGGLSVPVLRPFMELADDLVVHNQCVHQVVGEVVEADPPGFAVDFRGPWVIDEI